MVTSDLVGSRLGHFEVLIHCGHKQLGSFIVRSLLMSLHCGHKRLCRFLVRLL